MTNVLKGHTVAISEGGTGATSAPNARTALGLSTASTYEIASQAQAEGGVSSTTLMTPERTKNYVDAEKAKMDGCCIYLTGSQSINSGVATLISMTGEHYDDNTMHDTVTNPSRITIKRAGRYIITGAVNFASNATSGFISSLLKNGSEIARADIGAMTSTYSGRTPFVSIVSDLAVNDYIELQGTHFVASAVSAFPDKTFLCVQRVK